ncbi:MAG TPA: hypothetical protein VM450_00510 [Thermomicrobiales bacterium]|nr:hypothetical protein [Thermomicrobiales bacterium]
MTTRRVPVAVALGRLTGAAGTMRVNPSTYRRLLREWPDGDPQPDPAQPYARPEVAVQIDHGVPAGVGMFTPEGGTRARRVTLIGS